VSESVIKSVPLSDVDTYCYNYQLARSCLQFSTVCEDEEFEYDLSTGADQNACSEKLRELDLHFQSQITSANITAVTGTCIEEVARVDRSDQSCCLSSSYESEFYYHAEQSCVDGSVISTPEPICEVRLVRQTGTDKFHPALDNLAGTAVYGQEGPDNTFSIRYDWMNVTTFIFATKDHRYFQAMTKTDIGGALTGQYYSNGVRNFYSIQPGFSNWEQGSARMYNRNRYNEDPWISLRDHGYPRNQNQMMYGESGYSGGWHRSLMRAHGGLQVYVLTKGNFQDCIVEGGVGEFQNGVYQLREG